MLITTLTNVYCTLIVTCYQWHYIVTPSPLLSLGWQPMLPRCLPWPAVWRRCKTMSSVVPSSFLLSKRSNLTACLWKLEKCTVPQWVCADLTFILQLDAKIHPNQENTITSSCHYFHCEMYKSILFSACVGWCAWPRFRCLYDCLLSHCHAGVTPNMYC